MATQYLIGESGEPLPDGIVLAHTLYGEPHNMAALAHTMGRGGLAVIPVGEDGIAYVDPGDIPFGVAEPVPQPEADEPAARAPERDRHCIAKDDTCMGWQVTDSDYCAGHAGLTRKHVEVNVEPPTDA